MKILYLIITLLILTSCTLIGKELDEKSSKNPGETNDRYFENEGFGIDVKFIEAIINHKEKEKKSVKPIACSEEGERQVCTAIKGCWCEKT